MQWSWLLVQSDSSIMCRRGSKFPSTTHQQCGPDRCQWHWATPSYPGLGLWCQLDPFGFCLILGMMQNQNDADWMLVPWILQHHVVWYLVIVFWCPRNRFLSRHSFRCWPFFWNFLGKRHCCFGTRVTLLKSKKQMLLKNCKKSEKWWNNSEQWWKIVKQWWKMVNQWWTMVNNGEQS